MISEAQIKKAIGWLVSVLIVGGVAELLAHHVSKFAGYGLVFIVLLAYSITGDNLKEVVEGLRAIGLAI